MKRSMKVCTSVELACNYQAMASIPLMGQPKAANEGHLKTGQPEKESGTLIPTSSVVASVGMIGLISIAPFARAWRLSRQVGFLRSGQPPR